VRVSVRDAVLVADLGSVHRCLSSAVLGGGLGSIRTWLNAQVPHDYARIDPGADLAARAAGLAGPVVGMLTAADVARHTAGARGGARALATVGAEWALAAAGRRPRAVPPVGTINLLVVTDAPLTDAGLVNALQTAVEAKAQALAEAGVRARNAPGPATGTATDAIAVACPPGARVAFAGPATRVGADIAAAVHRAVLLGARADAAARAEPAAG
jgi:adenosylcobinamide amidohydrolase